MLHSYCGGGKWQPTPVLLPGKSHGRRSLVGCSPWGREELDTTERLHFHFSLSCIGEGNGNPLQCSCLENPRDWGAWWAAIYRVAQSQTWLQRLSSSSSSKESKIGFHLYLFTLFLASFFLSWNNFWDVALNKVFQRIEMIWSLTNEAYKQYVHLERILGKFSPAFSFCSWGLEKVKWPTLGY